MRWVTLHSLLGGEGRGIVLRGAAMRGPGGPWLNGGLAFAAAAVAVATLLMQGCGKAPNGQAPPGAAAPPAAPVIDATYVGRNTCAQCHAAETHDWTGSDHDLAMDPATPQTVLGDFNDATFTQFDLTTRFFRDGDKFMVRTEGPTGAVESFQVKYTFGVHPLQQYLIPFPDGRVQCLSIAWDTTNQRWFSLYPKERIGPHDWLHWTKAGQNWNYMCAQCHSTNLKKHYDLATDTYHTTFSEIDVSCEACHGPGSAHVDWAHGKGDDTYDFTGNLGLQVKLRDVDPQRPDPAVQKLQVETCARCHARRRIVHPDYTFGKPFLDAYAPELLRQGLYYPDGQIMDEVYVYGSFLQSKMYQKGVKCTDCHEPHRNRLRAQGNNLCIRCHDPGKFNTPAHHHHMPDSKGALCIECHMPQRTYMVVDPRRDHGFHLPRPDLTVSIGVPNACAPCHKDHTAQWAADKVVEWFGPIRPPDQHRTAAIAAGRAGRPDGEVLLAELINDTQAPGIIRATGLSLITQYNSPVAADAAARALRDGDALVRGSAVRNVEFMPPDKLDALLTPLLADPVRFVRTEAARVLSQIAPDRFADASKPDSAAFWAALDEYRQGQNAVNDQPGAHLNLAVLHENLHEPGEAEASYKTALRLDPTFVPARMNLAMLYDRQDRKDDAEAELREATRLQPKMAEAHYSLGLLLAERAATAPQAMIEAAGELAAAAALAPDNPRIQYNAGLAQQKIGRYEQAEPLLLAAQQLDAANADYLHALTILYVEQQQWDKALSYAQKLAAMVPSAPAPQQLLQFIRQQMKQPQR